VAAISTAISSRKIRADRRFSANKYAMVNSIAARSLPIETIGSYERNEEIPVRMKNAKIA